MLFSKLDAVNLVLVNAGQAPVSSLEDDSTSATKTAEFYLEIKRQEWVSQGLANNTYREIFSPDINGEITLPENTIKVTMDQYHPDLGAAPEAFIISKQGKLYNQTDRTYEWSTPVSLIIEEDITWEEIDIEARKSIAYEASRHYQLQHTGDIRVDALLGGEVQRHHARAKAHEIDTKNRHFLNRTTSRRTPISLRRRFRGSGNSRIGR